VTDREQFAADVRCGLTKRPRELPSRYLYDDLGSALFEAICHLPWYPITRAETRLLQARAGDIMRRVRPSTIVELGSGSGEKLRTLVEAAEAGDGALEVHIVDVSERALHRTAQALDAVPGVRLAAHRSPYERGLREALDAAGDPGARLVLFLGSNIGNFDPAGARRFLRGLRAELAPGDTLLLGVDLVKPEAEILRAYDDPLGVTAAFNRNLLVRVNRELDADFDVERFAHLAAWNARESRVEMHLVAQSDQDVHVRHAQVVLRVARGDTIWTESSYKYAPGGAADLLLRGGFSPTAEWIDEPGRFLLALATAA
jgi:L-histidine Nalpha-methyltransferase